MRDTPQNIDFTATKTDFQETSLSVANELFELSKWYCIQSEEEHTELKQGLISEYKVCVIFSVNLYCAED